MLRLFALLRRYSFVLIGLWMVLFSIDLVDDLMHNYSHRPPAAMTWMLLADFLRCLLVLAIWVAASYSDGRAQR